jgi:pimeloyl-ACP methyl ester carboxylesterase
METIQYQIPAGNEQLACMVNYAEGKSDPSIICLHGGGPAGMQSTEYLAEALQKNGKSVIRFDFSGQGRSSGILAASSLKKRLDETRAVLDYFGWRNEIAVIGTSMGGYIACRLIREVPINRLALFGPAAYTPRAWDVEFDKGFTEIIREDKSYLESDVQEKLQTFHGEALYVSGSNDTVIPKAVVDSYKRALSGCKKYEEYIIQGCPHPIHTWLMKHPKERKILEQKVIEWIE